jgi:hypothetical protein
VGILVCITLPNGDNNMNIEIDDNIAEGTEYEIKVNGRSVFIGVAEYDGDADDTANRIAFSLYGESLHTKLTITVSAI